MNKLISFLVGGVLGMFLYASTLYAPWVNGYYRSNGTYVSGYYRSEPNQYKYDNYSYKPSTYQTDNYNQSYYQKQYGKEYGKQYYNALKQSESYSKPVQVDGYYRSDGTYVESYGRNEPQSSSPYTYKPYTYKP